MSTDTAWDDKLHRPVANRAYFFLFVGSLTISFLVFTFNQGNKRITIDTKPERASNVTSLNTVSDCTSSI